MFKGQWPWIFKMFSATTSWMSLFLRDVMGCEFLYDTCIYTSFILIHSIILMEVNCELSGKTFSAPSSSKLLTLLYWMNIWRLACCHFSVFRVIGIKHKRTAAKDIFQFLEDTTTVKITLARGSPTKNCMFLDVSQTAPLK